MGNNAVSGNIKLQIRIIFLQSSHRLKQKMHSLKRIITLSQKNAVAFGLLRLPSALIKLLTHGFIHGIIIGPRIDLCSLRTVKLGSACNMIGKKKRLPLVPGTLIKLILLLTHGIPPYHIPEGCLLKHILRKSCTIHLCNLSAQALNTDQRLLWIVKGTYCCQTMRKLGSEYMNHIRFHILQDSPNPCFQHRIIVFRL